MEASSAGNRCEEEGTGHVNKLELVEHVAAETDTSKAAAAAALDAVIEGITKALKKGEEVRLVGFRHFLGQEARRRQGPQSRDRRGDQNSRFEERPLQARRDAEGRAQQESERELTVGAPASAARISAAGGSSSRRHRFAAAGGLPWAGVIP